jgi:hypothetical protein
MLTSEDNLDHVHYSTKGKPLNALKTQGKGRNHPHESGEGNVRLGSMDGTP